MRVGGVVFGCLMVQGRGRGEERGGTQKKKKKREGGRVGKKMLREIIRIAAC